MTGNSPIHPDWGAVRDQPEKLSQLGWGARHDWASLEPPGEVRDTWVILRWKPPVDGGATGFYKIQRKREGGPWEGAGTSTTLPAIPRSPNSKYGIGSSIGELMTGLAMTTSALPRRRRYHRAGSPNLSWVSITPG